MDNQFTDSILGTVETSLSNGPIYFNCYLDWTVNLEDANILDVLTLDVQLYGLDMKAGSIPVNIIYRVQYKVMNSCMSRVLKPRKTGETTLFLTDTTKAKVVIPKVIKWEDINFPQTWAMDRVALAKPQTTPSFESIKQYGSRRVEITFNRSNSFNTARSSFTRDSRSKMVGSVFYRKSFSTAPSGSSSRIKLQGVETSSDILTWL